MKMELSLRINYRYALKQDMLPKEKYVIFCMPYAVCSERSEV
jgi:hypothetical protein